MRRTGGIVSTSFAVDAVELNFMILLYYLEVRRRYSPQTKRIRNRIAGTNITFSTMLIIILPGGVTHELAGCCIDAIITLQYLQRHHSKLESSLLSICS